MWSPWISERPGEDICPVQGPVTVCIEETRWCGPQEPSLAPNSQDPQASRRSREGICPCMKIIAWITSATVHRPEHSRHGAQQATPGTERVTLRAVTGDQEQPQVPEVRLRRVLILAKSPVFMKRTHRPYLLQAQWGKRAPVTGSTACVPSAVLPGCGSCSPSHLLSEYLIPLI